MIGYTCKKCGIELQCMENGIALVHFLDGDERTGIDEIRFGDLYECRICGMGVVLGLSPEQYDATGFDQEFLRKIVNRYRRLGSMVEVLR